MMKIKDLKQKIKKGSRRNASKLNIIVKNTKSEYEVQSIVYVKDKKACYILTR